MQIFHPQLHVVEIGVNAVVHHQLLMRPLLFNAGFGEHQNSLGIPNCRKTMSNHDRRTILNELFLALPEWLSHSHYLMSCGLVQNNDRWIFQKNARDTQTLLLPAG